MKQCVCVFVCTMAYIRETSQDTPVCTWACLHCSHRQSVGWPKRIRTKRDSDLKFIINTFLLVFQSRWSVSMRIPSILFVVQRETLSIVTSTWVTAPLLCWSFPHHFPIMSLHSRVITYKFMLCSLETFSMHVLTTLRLFQDATTNYAQENTKHFALFLRVISSQNGAEKKRKFVIFFNTTVRLRLWSRYR